ncbi:TlpA disulfide reductase family protein [Spongiivirga citrea]|uniref:Redoxin domain-containing protein n=1 Tax=Spongiivirga citrea TaxID=1481457 RepID=A0A6M0CXG9_9FLAO|nr:TlpA disulfide reductase family protein [Spongiivirga citrea]NER18430.1 redoxin domain-containing protein [Spongiivirga citrea]
MHRFIPFLLLIVVSSCKEKKEEISSSAPQIPESTTTVFKSASQTIPFYTYDEFEEQLHKKDDKTYIVNFWATWCKPCVKELPAFEKLNANYNDKSVEVILVSMDFKQHIETKVVPFVDANKIKSEVVVLDDAKSHKWIPKVSEEWSGAIPATVIYNKDTRKFYERSFTYEELETEVQQFLN